MSLRKIPAWLNEIPGSLSEDRRVFSFNPVIGIFKTGKKSRWLAIVCIYKSLSDAQRDIDRMEITPDIAENAHMVEPYVAAIRVSFQIGDGVIREGVPTFVTSGKNLGRANETNPFSQALRDTLGIRNKQERKCTQASDARSEESTDGSFPAPMLAKWYSDRFKDTDDPSPIYVQRKYNGVRALCSLRDQDPIILSRKGKEYAGFPRLREEIRQICGAWKEGKITNTARGYLWLDGELYAHGKHLQTISGIVRGHSSTKDDELQFHLYDIFVTSRETGPSMGYTFSERVAVIAKIKEKFPALRAIKFVETHMFASDAEGRAIDKADKLYQQFLAEGYEGMIVRLDEPYEHGINDRHSKFLLKKKPIRDGEYEIVGYTTDLKGKKSGTFVFICAHEGREFAVTPTGEIRANVERAADFARVEKNGKTVFENHWKGQLLIVYYDALSQAGIPLQPRTNSELRTCP